MAFSPIFIQIYTERRSGVRWGAWILTALLASPAIAILAIKPLNDWVTAEVTGQLSGLLGDTVTIPPGTAGLSDEQRSNAQVIIEEGLKHGASQRDLEVAIAAALQECGLRNCDYGDRDSVGIFQQRPSQAWGSIAEIMDPSYSARAFFLGAGTNLGLLSIPDRDQMTLTEAAQAVQRSAYPNEYAKHEATAKEVVQAAMASRKIGGSEKVFPLAGYSMADMTSPYGYRIHPIRGTKRFHYGIDFGVPEGTPLLATESGTVESTILSATGCGNEVTLTFKDGTGARYCHLLSIDVEQGQTVKAGQAIGTVGNTGDSTGPHLHFERIEDGRSVDPTAYLTAIAPGESQSGGSPTPAPDLAPVGGEPFKLSPLPKIASLIQQEVPESLKQASISLIQQLSRKAENSVLGLQQPSGGLCGAVAVAADRVLTVAHCIKSAEVTIVPPGGEWLKGQVIKQDEATDLALIQVDGANFTVMPMGDSLLAGDPVTAIGYPTAQAGKLTVTPTTVQAVGNGCGIQERCFSVPAGVLSPGFSGGAMVDGRGYLVGINRAIKEETGVGYAIPMDTVKQFLE